MIYEHSTEYRGHTGQRKLESGGLIDNEAVIYEPVMTLIQGLSIQKSSNNKIFRFDMFEVCTIAPQKQLSTDFG